MPHAAVAPGLARENPHRPPPPRKKYANKKITKRTAVFGANLPRWAQPYRFLFGVFRSRGTVLAKALPQVALAMAMAVLWRHVWNHQFKYALPGKAFAAITTVTSFLLVFRTGLAYNRYYEGRKLLGGLVFHLSRLVRVCAADPGLGERVDLAGVARRANVLLAFVRQDLRESRNPPQARTAVVGAGRDKAWKKKFGPSPPGSTEVPFWLSHDDHGAPPLADLLRPDEARFYGTCNPHARVVAAAAELLRALLADLGDDPVSGGGLVGIVDEATSKWRGAARIIDTPMPFSYAHMLHLMLLLFTLLAAPLAFAENLEGYLMVPAAGVVALIFYGINELASEIENPFGWQDNDHNLTRFCKGLWKETELLVKWRAERGVVGGQTG